MGTSTISNVGKVFAPVQPAGGNAGSREEELKVAFAELMNQMSSMVGSGAQGHKGYPGKDTEVPAVSVDSQSRAYERKSYREVDVRAGENRQSVEREELAEKTDEFAEKATDVLKEELGVTDEQITSAMEQLGLSFADLLNPRQLASLVLELTGASDMSALLCNSEFLEVLQAVGELGAELLKELGITAEELQTMLEDASVGNVAEPDLAAQEETQWMDGTQMPVVMAESSAAASREAAAERGSVPEKDVKAATEEMADSKSLEGRRPEERAAHVTEENIRTGEVEMPVDEKKETPFSGGQDLGHQSAQTGDGEHVIAQQTFTESMVSLSAEPVETVPQVDTANIIRQIVEFARVTVGNAETTMELQLNPEHLGKVFLELTSKNGVVSAHLTAQNEAAREALESQLVELRQNLTQAGVKVEAVEVTVGSHEFERNLEQNAKRDEQQAEQQEKAAKQTRRINLGDLDELGGVMSEEESLVAQMMAEQGNSIDYTA